MVSVLAPAPSDIVPISVPPRIDTWSLPEPNSTSPVMAAVEPGLRQRHAAGVGGDVDGDRAAGMFWLEASLVVVAVGATEVMIWPTFWMLLSVPERSWMAMASPAAPTTVALRVPPFCSSGTLAPASMFTAAAVTAPDAVMSAAMVPSSRSTGAEAPDLKSTAVAPACRRAR